MENQNGQQNVGGEGARGRGQNRGAGGHFRGRGRGRGQAIVDGDHADPGHNGGGRGNGGRGNNNRGRGRGFGGRGRGGPPNPPVNPPPAPGPPVVTPPTVAAPPPLIPIPTLAERWGREYKLRATKDAHDVLLRDFSIDSVIVNVGPGGVNLHEVSAKIRELATVYAIVEMVKDGATIIDFRFGNFRDLVFTSRLNDYLVKFGHPANSITANVCDPHIVPADLARRMSGGVPAARHAIFVDVYAVGGSVDKPEEATPAKIASYQYDKVLWIGHMFDGFFGRCDTAAWYRRDDDMIVYRADKAAVPYPAHPRCAGMGVAGAGAGYAWFVSRIWTPNISAVNDKRHDPVFLYATTIARSNLVVGPHGFTLPSVGLFKTDIPDTAGMVQWCDRFIPGGSYVFDTPTCSRMMKLCGSLFGDWCVPKKSVKLSLDHFRHCSEWLSSRGRNGWILTNLQAEIAQYLRNDPTFSKVDEMFPTIFRNYRMDLAIAAFVDLSAARADLMGLVRDRYGADFLEVNTSRANIDAPRPLGASPSLWKLMLLASMGFGCFLSLRWCVEQVVNTVSVLKPTFGIAAPVGAFAALGVPNDASWPFARRLGVTLYRAVGALVRFATCQTNLSEMVLGDSGSIGMRPLSVGLTYGFYCVSIPLLEEWGKRMFGRRWAVPLSVLLAAYEAKPSLHFGVQYFLQDALTRGILHTLIGIQPYWKGVFLHGIVWNGLSCLGTFQNTRECYDPLVIESIAALNNGTLGASRLTKWLMIGGLIGAYMLWYRIHNYQPVVTAVKEEDNLIRDMASDETFILATESNKSEDVKNIGVDDTVKPDGVLSVVLCDQIEPVVEGYFRMWGHNAPMHKPANTVRNLRLMVMWRLTRPIKFKAEPGLWVTVYNILALSQRAHEKALDGIPIGKMKVSELAKGFVTERIDDDEQNRPSAVFNLIATQVEWAAAAAKFRDAGLPDPENWTPRVMVNWAMTGELVGGGSDLVCGPFIANRDSVSEGAWMRAFMAQMESPLNWANWLEHTDRAKRERYLAAREQVLKKPLTVEDGRLTTVKTNQKTDEVLLKTEWVGRPIHAVDPAVVVTIGPYVYACTEWLKDYFNFNCIYTYEFSGTTQVVTATIGAGMTCDALDRWFSKALLVPGVHVIVAGDDSFIVMNHGDILTFIEGDNSQHDHSVRLPALAAEWRILRDCGLPPRIMKMLEVNARASLIVGKRKREKLMIGRSWERNTGGVDTTIGNSLNVMMSLIGSIMRSDLHLVEAADRPDLIEASMASFGFEMKTKLFVGSKTDLGHTFYPGSFLKGTWWLTEEGQWAWGPLLSKLLKIGKTLSDPRLTQRFKASEKISLDVALYRQRCAIAKGLLPFGLHPVIRNWLKNHISDCPSSGSVGSSTEDVGEFWRPRAQSSIPSLDSTSYIHQAAQWYGVEPEQIHEFLMHVSRIGFKQSSMHPLWTVLASRDYA